MNGSSGRGRGRWRSLPRWAATLAAMALTGLLATACGGGSSPAASSTGGSASVAGGATREQATLAYARCMRSHGVPNFPDPQITNGGIGVPGGFTFDTSGLGLHQKSPQYQAAARACQSLATHAKG